MGTEKPGSSLGAIELLVIGTIVLSVIGGGLAVTATFSDNSVSSGVDVQIDRQFVVPQFDSINQTDIRTSSPGSQSVFRTQNGTTLRVVEESVADDSLTVTVPIENAGGNRGTVRLSADSSTTPFTIGTTTISESFANNSTFARTPNHTVISDTDALVELPPTTGTEPRAVNVTLNYESTPASPLTATFELSPTSSRANIQPGDPTDGGNGDGGAGGGGGDGGAGGGADGGDGSGGDGRLVFAQRSGDSSVRDVRSLGKGRDLVFSYGVEESVKALGPSTANFDDDDAIEIPVVVRDPNNDGNQLLFVDDNGDVGERRIGGVKSGRVAVGSFDGSPESAFFIGTNANGDRQISRFTPETEQGPTRVSDVKAQAVAGIADVDGDDAAELVFGGEGPNGNSDRVNYIDDAGSLKGTGVGYGSDDGAGVGRPADFDDDSQARIPTVDGNNDIVLVGESGGSTVLADGGLAKKAPVGTTDWDGDGDPEIMFLATDGELKYVDNVTDGNVVRTPVDNDGNTFTRIDSVSGLSGGRRAAAQTQTASRTDADSRTQIVYENANDELAARNESGTISTPNVPGTIKATGSPADLTDGPSDEYPVVLSDNSGTLKLNGSGEALATDIKTQPLAVRSSVDGPGRFATGSPSIFHTRSSDRAIRRVTPGGSSETYTSVSAQVVAGPADIDGDNAAEIVFGGNSPSGNSQTINYLDDDGSLEGTGMEYGSNNAAGVGQPADFNNDGIARMPIVNGNQRIALIDAAGRETVLADDKAKKTPLATVDYDDDSALEIVYIEENGELRYIDNVSSDNTVRVVGDNSDSGVSADSEVGVR